VRLFGDRAVGHRAGAESLMIDAGALDFVERKCVALGTNVITPRSVTSPWGLIVDQRGYSLNYIEALRARACCSFLHGAGIEQVNLSVTTPLVLTVISQFTLLPAPVRRHWRAK